MSNCPNCNNSDTKAIQRTTVTGCGPRGVSERWRCNSCHDDFRLEIEQSFIPFGESIESMFGPPCVTTKNIK